MLYLVEVNALAAAVVTAFILIVSAIVVLAIWAWRSARAYAAARFRIQKRAAVLVAQRHYFATPLAISRNISRAPSGGRVIRRQIQ